MTKRETRIKELHSERKGLFASLDKITDMMDMINPSYEVITYHEREIFKALNTTHDEIYNAIRNLNDDLRTLTINIDAKE